MGDRRSPPGQVGGGFHAGATRLLSTVMIVLGVLLVVRAAGILGVVLGIGMVGAGAGRLWVVARLRRGR